MIQGEEKGFLASSTQGDIPAWFSAGKYCFQNFSMSLVAVIMFPFISLLGSLCDYQVRLISNYYFCGPAKI